ncbi:winged helix-turn-helix domain-containing protein [Streptomyces sp. N2-109]|uniref:Winged helix-turn-helix domain-containing protein n=1 Tax=Streptomyces gossypii TaxID=2883101 RepID=A0ABT2JPZ3_9ACTN|nr:BTAD domain-containing putative transcriptional regulator [Streptomyces gossypii]MCT2589949.1 winged helix-turn-helix domain-containing protein [Streptomyces gossypii]
MLFGVLGPLAVWDGEGRPVRVPEVKVRALLADLLVHEGRPVSADRLIDDLWGGEPPGNPANALQAKVSQLRRALGRDRVLHQPPGYRLRLDGAGQPETEAEVDADRFRSLTARARLLPDPGARAAQLSEALEMWRGPAYADFADEEFVRAAAHRLAELRLAVLEEQAEARLAAGDHTLLSGELADLVAHHPLRERLRAVQLRALYRAGRQNEALASYAELRERLADELGLDPGPELAALHQAILRQDVSLAPPPVAASALEQAPPTPVRPRSNLPASLTALVGRDRSLGELGQLLGPAASAPRLVTLTGPGGVGKTRLAVEAATRLAQGAEAEADVPDGVWLVELAGQRGGGVDELVQLISTVLGVRDDAPSGLPGLGGAPPAPADRLAAALRDRRTLLVLDNCEQVVGPAAELAELLLRAAPGLRVLATSREPLGLTGEAVYLVEPLQTADAVRLFTARAAASAPGFAPDEAATREAVAEICRRLDGIPLALELAATRVRGLGIRELAARLGDSFRVLTSGRRGAPARQQTLRAVIDWSWELLSTPERVVLSRLAVHRDGCTLEAAEAVCAGDGVPREEVLDLVTRLVDRSLVVMVDGGSAGTAPRYRLFESVAAYATERLREREDLTGVRVRHLRYYLELAERAEPRLRGGDQQAWLARLDAESANLRAALDEAGGTEEAVRLATALAWWWLLRGRLSEAHRSLAAVLSAAPEDAVRSELPLLRQAFALLTGDRTSAPAADAPQSSLAPAHALRHARSLWLFAYGLFNAGDPAASEDANARAFDLFTSGAPDAADPADPADVRWGTAATLGLRAMHALTRGDLTTLEYDGLRSAGIHREVGDRWGELQTVQPLAALAEIKGDYAEAAHLQGEGLHIAEELGLEAEVSTRLSGLGRLALLAHEWDRARALHERARQLAATQGSRYGEIHAEMGLALGARRSGDLDGAERHLLHIRDRHSQVSSAVGDHLLHAELGFLAEQRGDAAQASAHHLRGLDLARSIGDPRALALSLEGLAGAAALAGDPAAAARAALLLGAAHAARHSVNAPLPRAERADVDRITATATATLGQAAFTESFQQGTTLAPAAAVRC